jgi:hypothetical protein
VTNSFLSPPLHSCACPTPVSRRQRPASADGNPQRCLRRQNPDHSARHHRSDRACSAQNHGRDTRSAVVPVRNRKIRATEDTKSPESDITAGGCQARNSSTDNSIVGRLPQGLSRQRAQR